mgnify:CR=1 FL=1
MIKSTFEELLKRTSEEEAHREKNATFAPIQYKSLREDEAKIFLLHNAMIHDATTSDYNTLEFELRGAFDAGMKIVEYSNGYYPNFNESTKKIHKKIRYSDSLCHGT